MAKREKEWHKNFIKYAEFIVNHPNYQGLPIKRKEDGSLVWVAPKTTEIGAARKKWAEDKARELGYSIEAGVYAKVMLQVHPTKEKVCHICGKTMSLYYIYANANFQKTIKKDFDIDSNDETSIFEISSKIENLKDSFFTKKYLIDKFNLNIDLNNELLDIIKACEIKCRNGECKYLGPGAMSNFPDRFDGYHSYNRCCRKKEDTGRFDDNMKTYSKDRRAYEYWSDGNIQAANKFMGSSFFKGTSADHVGPISLGFIHDSIQLRPLPSGANSTKRDRLDNETIEEVIRIEKENGISCMSWYNRLIWNYIKDDYTKHLNDEGYLEKYRIALKTNVANFMYCLKIIKTETPFGTDFLIKSFLEPNLVYFTYDYTFNDLGKITSKTKRNITDATKKEADRYFRIALDAVDDYDEKDNRNIKVTIDNQIKNKIKFIAKRIPNGDYVQLKKEFVELMDLIQKNVIEKI